MLRCVAPYLWPNQLVMIDGLKNLKFTYEAPNDCLSVEEFNYLFGQFSGISITHAYIYGGCEGRRVEMGKHLKDLVFLFVSGNINLDFVNKCRNLRELVICDNDLVKNLDGFKECRKLKRINVIECKGMVDVTALGEFRDLRMVSLYRCGEAVEGMLNFRKCWKLQFVEIGECRNFSVKFLSSCCDLRSLYFYGNKNVNDLSALKECRKLRFLNLNECVNIVDVSFLGLLGKLTELKLNGCTGISNVSFLGNLVEKLRKVDLSGCKMKNMMLGGMKKLRKVNLSGCELLEELRVEGCEKLRELDLNGCVKLERLHIGEDCGKKLKKLNLYRCRRLVEPDFSLYNELKWLNCMGIRCGAFKKILNL